MENKDTAAKVLPQPTVQQPTISEFEKSIALRSALRKKIDALKSKATRTEDEDLIIAGSEAKLIQIEQGQQGMFEMERTFRFKKAADSLLNDAIVNEEMSFVIKYRKDESGSLGVTVDRVKSGSRDAAKADGVTGTKREFDWLVQGKVGSEATEIIKIIGDSMAIVMQSTSSRDTLGVCGRLGWKVAPGLGPITNRMQGKDVKQEGTGLKIRIPHVLRIPDGTNVKEYTIDPNPDHKLTALYAHKEALLHLAKNKQAKPVQMAIGYIRSLLQDAMIEDKVATKDAKVDVATLQTYIKSLHKFADKAVAAEKVNP